MPGGADAIHQNGINPTHISPPDQDTADFADNALGNLRVDYVLPSNNLPIASAGVFWPTNTSFDFSLVGTFNNPNLFAGFASSDHKAAYVDVIVVPEPTSVALVTLAAISLHASASRRRR